MKTSVFIALAVLASVVALLGGGTASTGPAFAQPANDDFADAVPLTSADLPFVNEPMGMSTVGATTEVGEPQPSCAPAGSTVWYRFTASADGDVVADTLGGIGPFDTVLAAYTGTSLVDLNEVACDDDHAGSQQSRLVLTLTAGQTVFFQIGGYGGDQGDLRFNLGVPLPRDSDQDGFTDEAEFIFDSDGANSASTPESFFVYVQMGIPLCSNGRDEDLDGLVDDADPGCAESDFDPHVMGPVEDAVEGLLGSDPSDPSSYPEHFLFDAAVLPNMGYRLCEDGYDNDLDGLPDGEDPGCKPGQCLDFTDGETRMMDCISLEPKGDSSPMGSDHTVIATISESGTSLEGVPVAIVIDAGPNQDEPTFIGDSDASGEVAFTYTGDGGLGTDTIAAVFSCELTATDLLCANFGPEEEPRFLEDFASEQWTPSASPAVLTLTPTPTPTPAPTEQAPAAFPPTGGGSADGGNLPWLAIAAGVIALAVGLLVMGAGGLRAVRTGPGGGQLWLQDCVHAITDPVWCHPADCNGHHPVQPAVLLRSRFVERGCPEVVFGRIDRLTSGHALKYIGGGVEDAVVVGIDEMPVVGTQRAAHI